MLFRRSARERLKPVSKMSCRVADRPLFHGICYFVCSRTFQFGLAVHHLLHVRKDLFRKHLLHHFPIESKMPKLLNSRSWINTTLDRFSICNFFDCTGPWIHNQNPPFGF